MTTPIRIFTDGASSGNPGPGGWGAIIASHQSVTELGAGETKTTNNRMELAAAIEGLTYVSSNIPEADITLYTDSKYVLNGATQWIKGWKKNNWQTSQKKEVLNRDLWEKLDALLPKVKCKWISLEGHSGIPGNERADVIATSFAKKESIELYDGPLSHYTVDMNDLEGSGAKKQEKDRSKLKAYSYLSLVDGVLQKHVKWADCEDRVKGKKGVRFRKAISPEDEAAIIKEWGVK